MFEKNFELGMDKRLSVAELALDNRLYFRFLGLSVWGDGYNAQGRLVIDQPDQTFAKFAEARLSRTLLSAEPELASCIVWATTQFGRLKVPYTAITLPCSKPGDSEISTVLSITRLHPSQYRSLLETHGHLR